MPRPRLRGPPPRRRPRQPGPTSPSLLAIFPLRCPAPLCWPRRLGGSPSSCVHCPGRRTSPARCSSRLLRSLPLPNLERYFILDPILDPPQWPKTGWFTDVQIDIIHPHLFGNQWKATAVTSAGRSVNVATGVARLDWTVAPRLELGYRLLSGFGEFSLSDRGFYTDGSGPFNGPAGNFTRTSHLGVNYTDMDYASREYTQWPNWTMKWRAGVRVAYTWLDSTVSQPFSAAAAGTGVYADRAVNYTAGAGPHFGVGLDHNFAQPGLSFLTNLDIADTFTRIRQRFTTATTTLTPAGQPARGEFQERFWNEVPILNFKVGLGYQPPNHPNIHLYAGYVYEFWWQVGTESNTARSHLFFDNQGVTLSAAVDF